MPVWDTHAEYDKQSAKWTRARDAVSGQDVVHGKGVIYLPQLKDQDDNEYRAYKKRATWFGASAMVVSGLVGMIFRMPPKKTLPVAALSMLDDIDMAGTPLDTFAQEFTEEILTVGRVGILVDHPPSVDLDGAPITVAQAQLLNIRPTMQLYKTEQILNWKHRRVKNAWALSMVVLEEIAMLPGKDEWDQKHEKRWRVLDLDDMDFYRQRVFRKPTDAERAANPHVPEQIQIGDDVYPVIDGQKINFIPFYPCDEDDVDICPDEPPLIDLFDLNLAHYRVTADYEHGCHFTGLPTPVISGYTPEQTEDGKPPPKLYVGSSHAWVFPDPQAKATYLEFHGTGLTALEKNLDRKEGQMALVGSRMLTPEHNGKTPTGATTTVVNRTGESSRLASISAAASTAFTRALKVFCQWGGMPSTGVEYRLNKDFLPIIVDSNALNALVAAVAAKTLPFDDFWSMLQRGDIVPVDKEASEALSDIQSQPEFVGQAPTKKADAAAPESQAKAGGVVK
jgi:hypothetical protein